MDELKQWILVSLPGLVNIVVKELRNNSSEKGKVWESFLPHIKVAYRRLFVRTKPFCSCHSGWEHFIIERFL